MTKPEIIIIGAGIIGAAIAWHLAASGARVTILDAGEGGGVATPNSFAWINASHGNPEPYFRLRTRSMAEWRRLAAAVPGLAVSWCGGLLWGLPHPELEAYVDRHGRWGYELRLVEAAEAARIEPRLTEMPSLAAYAPGEGAVEPVRAARAILADAQRRGAAFLSARKVDGFLIRRGRIIGVRTWAGDLLGDEIVLAAGAEITALARLAGVNVSLARSPGLLVHSRPVARRLLNGLVLAPTAHIRQTVDGRIVAGGDFGGSDPGVDADSAAAALFQSVQAMLQGGDALELDFHTVGYRPMPEDGLPIVGRVDGVRGLYIAVMHSGITLAPAIGRFVADELLDGRRDALLSPFGFERFR